MTLHEFRRLQAEPGAIEKMLAAIPAGWAIGYGLAYLLVTSMASETYRIPLVVSAQTYLYSATATLMAGVIVIIMGIARFGAVTSEIVENATGKARTVAIFVPATSTTISPRWNWSWLAAEPGSTRAM